MFNVTLKVYNELYDSEILSLYLGVFNRVSTAEKRRRELQENNPTFKFVCIYEPF